MFSGIENQEERPLLNVEEIGGHETDFFKKTHEELLDARFHKKIEFSKNEIEPENDMKSQ